MGGAADEDDPTCDPKEAFPESPDEPPAPTAEMSAKRSDFSSLEFRALCARASPESCRGFLGLVADRLPSVSDPDFSPGELDIDIAL